MAHFLTTVLTGLEKFPDSILIRYAAATSPELIWSSVTYREYAQSLHKAAAHWKQTLRASGLVEQDVVGLWLTGEVWTDLVHLYAISRAGFVPEVFSIRYSHPGGVVVRDLLRECNAKALVYVSRFADVVKQIDFLSPSFEVIDIAAMTPSPDSLGPLPTVEGEDVAIIFHTSGTTGGRPKPIPETHRWITALTTVNWPGIWQGGYKDGPDVFNNMGSLAHIGAALSIPKFAPFGACLVIMPRLDISVDNFLSAVRNCGLNRLSQYANWLTKLIATARENPDVLQALQGVRQVAFTGSPLSPADEKWALDNGIPITVFYASTECAPCMVSTLRSGNMHFRFIPGVQCRMIPAGVDPEANGQDQDSSRPQLYEFFVPAHARNCPHVSIRNRPDGHAPGDFFEEVEPGAYLFRGRRDDWIRCTEPGLIDAKDIESNVLKTCPDIVDACVVVGNYRPHAVLMVEPHATPTSVHGSPDENKQLKEQIVERIASFNDRLFPFERINCPSRIIVVSPGLLPRTAEKGNIKRKATEEIFATLIDRVYLCA